MTTKLTLSIDARLIEKAKKRSKKKGLSLSKIIEGFLREFTTEEESVKKRSAVEELTGIIAKVPKDFDYDEEMFKSREAKHK